MKTKMSSQTLWLLYIWYSKRMDQNVGFEFLHKDKHSDKYRPILYSPVHRCEWYIRIQLWRCMPSIVGEMKTFLLAMQKAKQINNVHE